jgi:beta-lactamase class A
LFPQQLPKKQMHKIARLLHIALSLAAATLLTASSLTLPDVVTSVATAKAKQPSQAWTFPQDSQVAGVDVGGQTRAQAIDTVQRRLAKWQAPLPLTVDPLAATPEVPVLMPAEVGVTVDAAQLVREAEQQAHAGTPVNVPWSPEIDIEQLYAKLNAVAPAFEQTAAVGLLVDTDALTSTYTFGARPGITLDIDATAALLMLLLQERPDPLPATVALSTTETQPATLFQVQQVLEQQISEWDGVVGVYVYDLETDQAIGINDVTVFSGASVMKVPIMLYTYLKLGSLSNEQQQLMEQMIVESDNRSANALLAAAAGGQDEASALQGVREMSEMLSGLGFQYTYQFLPYGSRSQLARQFVRPTEHPLLEGEPPYTKPDPFIRTTPREMAQFFVMLVECVDGKGLLIQKYGDTLSSGLCSEMIEWLAQPRDLQWMVAGIEPGIKVAHKSGWLHDMQSDVGIVYSPNGRYVAAIFVWREGQVDTGPSPYLANISHTIYSFFNAAPLP